MRWQIIENCERQKKKIESRLFGSIFLFLINNKKQIDINPSMHGSFGKNRHRMQKKIEICFDERF